MKYLFAISLLASSAMFAKASVADGSDEITWMQHCDPAPSTIAQGGIYIGSEIEAITFFDEEFLQPCRGNEISLVAVYVRTQLDNAVITISKSDDPTVTRELVSSQPVQCLFPGWNFVRLDKAVEIDGEHGLCIGYRFVDNGMMPVALDASADAKPESSLFVCQGVCSDVGIYFGNLMIRAAISGDTGALGDKLSIQSLKARQWIYKDEPLTATFRLGNNSFTPVKSAVLTYKAGDHEYSRDIAFETPISANSSTEYSLTVERLTDDSNITFRIAKVNGKEVSENTAETTKHIEVYDKAMSFERTALIEEFTGQTCGNCPKGAKAIEEAVKGRESRVARINHHSGYFPDAFTIDESVETATFFGITSAPSCMLDRSVQDSRADIIGANDLVWNPMVMTTDIVDSEIERPAVVSVDITAAIDTDTKTLTADISGKTFKDLRDARLTVVLTQSQYTAYQASASSKYLHDDFPIAFLTPYNGESVNISDGQFHNRYNYIVEEKYNRITTDIARLKVVAFVTQKSNDVLNAAVRTVEQTGASISEIPDDKLSIWVVVGNRIECSIPDAAISVFTICGRQIVNDNLPKGIYLVNIDTGNHKTSQKVIIR